MQTYVEPAYAAERLVGTIVRANNKAVKINNIGIAGDVDFTYLTMNKRDIGKLENLDITPVPLGFCNYNGGISYLSRCPVRQDWKQGLRSRTLRSSNRNWGPDDIPFKVIGKTIENDYPKFEDIFKILESDKVHAIAWCRDFAIDKNLNIFYKAILEPIGKFLDIKERRFSLEKRNRWVEESLVEAINA